MHLIKADTFWKRGIGLIGRRGLESGTGLLLSPCRSIHTCFMRFPIDVIFLDDAGRVVRICQNIPPWRLVWGGRQARSVIEVPSGRGTSLPAIGDKVELPG